MFFFCYYSRLRLLICSFLFFAFLPLFSSILLFALLLATFFVFPFYLSFTLFLFCFVLSSFCFSLLFSFSLAFLTFCSHVYISPKFSFHFVFMSISLRTLFLSHQVQFSYLSECPLTCETWKSQGNIHKIPKFRNL